MAKELIFVLIWQPFFLFRLVTDKISVPICQMGISSDQSASSQDTDQKVCVASKNFVKCPSLFLFRFGELVVASTAGSGNTAG